MKIKIVIMAVFCVTAVFECAEIEVDDPYEAAYGKIQHASIIFRHGDRSPLETYPRDPYRNYLWPEGLGQVLDKGKRRMYKLGKWFRQRYAHLMPARYISKSIFVQSSDVDRTIVSAQCFLYGFYEDEQIESWKKNEKWRPIPVHSIPNQFDNLINFGLTNTCPTEIKRVESSNSDPQIKKLYNDNLEIFPYIEGHSGLNIADVDEVRAIKLVLGLRGILAVQAENNLQLPKWTEKVYPQPLSSIKLQAVKIYWTNKKRRTLALGPIFKSILDDMRRKIKNEFPQVLHVYSAHDTILDGLFYALNSFNERTDYSTTLIFELRKNSSDNTSIVTVSKKIKDHQVCQLLSLPTCDGSSCTFEQFALFMDEIIPVDWHKECQGISDCKILSSNIFIVIISITSSLIIFPNDLFVAKL